MWPYSQGIMVFQLHIYWIDHNPNTLNKCIYRSVPPVTLLKPHDAIASHGMAKGKPVCCQPYYLHKLLFLFSSDPRGTAYPTVSPARQKLGVCDTVIAIINRTLPVLDLIPSTSPISTPRHPSSRPRPAPWGPAPCRTPRLGSCTAGSVPSGSML